MKMTIGLSIILAAGLAACGKAPKIHSGTAVGTTQNGNADPNNPGMDPTAAAMLTCSLTDGKQYKGFGNVNLVAGRPTEVAKDGDRYRVKPYTSLSGEYTRVMGAVPASLTANAATFAAAPDRWYVTTEASAVTLFTSYRVAYEAGLALAASDSKYAAVPTESTATENCTTFARQAWNRLPSAEEVNACKNVALVVTAAETDIKARWAYTLASVLTAAGFLAY